MKCNKLCTFIEVLDSSLKKEAFCLQVKYKAVALWEWEIAYICSGKYRIMDPHGKKRIVIKGLKRHLPEDFFHVFSLIINNEENHVCQVVKKIFAVNADGEIFACHLLNGVERNCLGNIRGINIFNSTPSFQFVLEDMQFKNTEKCLSCWAQRLCGGCAVHGFYHKEKQEFKKEPNGDHCAFMKQYLEKIILFISSIRKNNDLWLRLVDYANSINGNSN